MRELAKRERTRTKGTRPYLLRGLVRCGLCSRKTQGALIRKEDVYYRCLARSLVPGSAALAGHSRTVNLREDNVVPPLNAWIGRLFSRANVDRTVAELLASQDAAAPAASHEALKKRVSTAGGRLRRFPAAIEARGDPAATVEAPEKAQ